MIPVSFGRASVRCDISLLPFAIYFLDKCLVNGCDALTFCCFNNAFQCSFYEDMLLIMIPTSKNLFEAGSAFHREDFIDDSKAFLKEMNRIFSVIDFLRVDQDVGL